jgi:hypothetical protein
MQLAAIVDGDRHLGIGERKGHRLGYTLLLQATCSAVNSNWKLDLAMTMLCSSRCKYSIATNQHSTLQSFFSMFNGDSAAVSDSPEPMFSERSCIQLSLTPMNC